MKDGRRDGRYDANRRRFGGRMKRGNEGNVQERNGAGRKEEAVWKEGGKDGQKDGRKEGCKDVRQKGRMEGCKKEI